MTRNYLEHNYRTKKNKTKKNKTKKNKTKKRNNKKGGMRYGVPNNSNNNNNNSQAANNQVYPIRSGHGQAYPQTFQQNRVHVNRTRLPRSPRSQAHHIRPGHGQAYPEYVNRTRTHVNFSQLPKTANNSQAANSQADIQSGYPSYIHQNEPVNPTRNKPATQSGYPSYIHQNEPVNRTRNKPANSQAPPPPPPQASARPPLHPNTTRRQPRQPRVTRKKRVLKSNRKGSYKTMSINSVSGNYEVNNAPHRSNLGNDPGLFIVEPSPGSTNENIKEHTQELIKEMYIQRVLSEHGLSPRVNNNFVDIRKIGMWVQPKGLKAFYVQRMTPFDVFNFTNNAQIETLFRSLMHNLNRLISEFGCINLDIKEDNLILNIHDPNTVEVLFIDTDPNFFKKIISRSEISQDNTLIKKYVPFISLLQILLFYYPTHFTIRKDLKSIGTTGSRNSLPQEQRNRHFDFIIHFVKDYISTNDIKKNELYYCLSILNRKTIDTHPTVFHLYKMILHYCFPNNIQHIHLYNNAVLFDPINGPIDQQKIDMLAQNDVIIQQLLEPYLNIIFQP